MNEEVPSSTRLSSSLSLLLCVCFCLLLCGAFAQTKTGLRMPGVFVVHLDWLMNSVWHCRRERETMFLLAGVSHEH